MANFKWTTDNDMFEDLKKDKKRELNESCQEDIEHGFTIEKDGVSYHVHYDRETQHNIQDVLRLFDNEMIDTYMMTVHTEEGDDPIRLPLTKEEFITLHQESVIQRERKISKLRDVLNPLVDSLTKTEDVKDVNWEQTHVLSEDPKDITLNQENRIDKQIVNFNETFDALLPKEEGNQ